jgi:histidinol-phosphate phosphatase family protein
MVEIRGKPFLEYQIEQLREQGFEKVLLLLGYLPEVVQKHFGDGSAFGVTIEYSASAVEDETARRLKLAAPRLDANFLLLYCDNYWPMQIDRMWLRFAGSDVPAMITVYSNKDGYTRNSVRVGPDGYVEVYDKTCAAPGLGGVEISYALINRSIIELLPDSNISVEEALYTRLAQQKQLLAYVTDHRYYSVGALHRLPLTEAFFARRPTVILDRDGVLNKKPAKAEYVRSWNEFEWLPGAKEALRLLNEAGWRVILVTNQAGVGRGVMSENDLLQIHQRMKSEAGQAGGDIEAIYYCPHDWHADCECRKPKPGLLFQAQKEHHLDLTRILYIGDDERDRQAAELAGCRFAMVTSDDRLLEIIQRLVRQHELQ